VASRLGCIAYLWLGRHSIQMLMIQVFNVIDAAMRPVVDSRVGSVIFSPGRRSLWITDSAVALDKDDIGKATRMKIAEICDRVAPPLSKQRRRRVPNPQRSEERGGVSRRRTVATQFPRRQAGDAELRH
jgi:hypothetical protein